MTGGDWLNVAALSAEGMAEHRGDRLAQIEANMKRGLPMNQKFKIGSLRDTSL